MFNLTKRLAIGTNDLLVSVGLFILIFFTALATGTVGWMGLVWGLVGLLLWAIGSGFWCVLSGIHDELKKLNEKS